MNLPPPIDEQRAALERSPLRAPIRYRVLHIGTYWQGETDIVRRMVEALRSLGHEVAAIDPRTWPALESSRRTDGIHAIELDVGMLDPLIDRFRPDLIIFNAGGYHPSPAGAAHLRARGIPLVHVVLSDPDVREATLSYLDRFDVIATNARACVAEYERAGARVVRHMPFAVDRTFVLRRVQPHPDRQADVICVGHGRPDRQETMRTLATRFGVRVYGAKWDLPAEIARGDDVIAALDQGTFHVNFPRTYAGFTNVKVGVFESVARGGVLCTERFDEMAELFAYGEEIVGYESADGLTATIERMLAHPDEIEAIRRRAFSRLLRDHLYEHRWIALFENLRALRILPEVGTPRTRRLVVIDLEGDVDLEALAGDHEDAVVRAITPTPVRALEQGFESVPLGAVGEAALLLRDADVIVTGDGSGIADSDIHRAFARVIASTVSSSRASQNDAAKRIAYLERALETERARYQALRRHPVVRSGVALKRLLKRNR